MSSSLGDENRITRIDPEGDVVLHFQDESRMQVSSKVLSCASKAFATMFTPQYLEGQSLDARDPPSILFPDDDPRAFQRLCLLLYHKEDQLELGFCNSPNEEQLLIKLLILAGKYDCIRAVKSQVALLFRDLIAKRWSMFYKGQHGSSTVFICLLDTIAASYILKDARLFWETTRDLIYSTGPLQTMTLGAQRPGQHLVPSNLWSRDSCLISVQYRLTSLQ